MNVDPKSEAAQKRLTELRALQARAQARMQDAVAGVEASK
jgi:hypothetical protein